MYLNKKRFTHDIMIPIDYMTHHIFYSTYYFLLGKAKAIVHVQYRFSIFMCAHLNYIFVSLILFYITLVKNRKTDSKYVNMLKIKMNIYFISLESNSF